MNILETHYADVGQGRKCPCGMRYMFKTTEDMLKEEGEENPAEIMEIVLDSWKSIVDKSEIPWALCDECYESIQIYIKKRGS